MALEKSYQRLILISDEKESWALIVSEVYGVYQLAKVSISKVPVNVQKAQIAYTKGVFEWQEKYVGILDEKLLFSSLRRSVR